MRGRQWRGLYNLFCKIKVNLVQLLTVHVPSTKFQENQVLTQVQSNSSSVFYCSCQPRVCTLPAHVAVAPMAACRVRSAPLHWQPRPLRLAVLVL